MKKVAVCYFGHLRTLDLNYPNHLRSLKNLNFDIHIHTWNFTDISSSWHNLNDELRQDTNSFLESLPNIFLNSVKTIKIEEQDEIINNNIIDVFDHTGTLKKVNVGHQYHLWYSINCVFKQAIKYSEKEEFDYEYYIFIRPDIKINQIIPNNFNVQDNFYYFPWPNSYFELEKLKLWDIFFITNKSFSKPFEKIMNNIKNQSIEFVQYNGYHSLKTLLKHNITIKPIVGKLYYNIIIIRRPKGLLNKLKAWYFFVWKK